MASFWRNMLHILVGVCANTCAVGGEAAAPTHEEEFYFLQALNQGKLEEIRAMVAKTPGLLTVRDKEGQTVLHRIARGSDYSPNASDSPEVVGELLKLGADAKATDSKGYTPLHHVCESEYGNMHLCDLLLEAGISVNAKTASGATPLHVAMARPKALFRKTTLFPQQHETNIRVQIQYLVARGAALEARDHLGRTPLHHAAMTGTLIDLQELLAAKADINARDKNGRTPLFLAGVRAWDEGCAYLASKGGKGEITFDEFVAHGVIHHLVEAGKLDWVRRAVRQNPKLVHVLDDDGRTPLHVAAEDFRLIHEEAYSLEMVKVLVEAGADVNAMDQRNETPLFYCSRSMTPKETARAIQKLLLSKGAVPIHMARLPLVKEGWNFDRIKAKGPVRAAAREDIASLEKELASPLPPGVGDFMVRFGAGTILDVRVPAPKEIPKEQEWFRQWVQEYGFKEEEGFFRASDAFSADDLKNLIRLAYTGDGSEIVFVRNRPEIYLLPRHDDHIHCMGRSWQEALLFLNKVWFSEDYDILEFEPDTE